jgi:hypothetical protein
VSRVDLAGKMGKRYSRQSFGPNVGYLHSLKLMIPS